jgi:hypothetical protein
MNRYTLRPSRRTALKRARLARSARDTSMELARMRKARGLECTRDVLCARIFNRRVVQCLREAGEVRS